MLTTRRSYLAPTFDRVRWISVPSSSTPAPCRLLVTIVLLYVIRSPFNSFGIVVVANATDCHPRLGSSVVTLWRSNPSRRSTSVGWQATLQCPPLVNMSIPALISFNFGSLFMKLLNLSSVLQSPIHVHTCVLCRQESWPNLDVMDSLMLVYSLKLHRQERGFSQKKHTGTGEAT